MRTALIQLTSTREINQNLATSRRLAEAAAEAGARWILFPENAPFMGPDPEKLAIAETIEGPIVDFYREIARETNTWITLGSFPEKTSDEKRTLNTSLMIDPNGQIVAAYRKIHLFDVETQEGQVFCESDSVQPGKDLIVTPVSFTNPDGAKETRNVGLTICYDLRFPELYRALVNQGAHVLTVPAAFTLATGRDHWHPLLQARAIENQCYVLAPNQWGNNYGNRHCYGHSVIYDPWGRQIACASDREMFIIADLDFKYLDQVRQKMPCLSHQRLR